MNVSPDVVQKHLAEIVERGGIVMLASGITAGPADVADLVLRGEAANAAEAARKVVDPSLRKKK